jgi:hypothetical protein
MSEETSTSDADPIIIEQHAHKDEGGVAFHQKMDAVDIQNAIRTGSVPKIKNEKKAIGIAKQAGWEIDALMTEMENELAANPRKKTMFDIEFANPKTFTFLLVAFASMGGLLSGLDQSLISGANLFLPVDLNLTTQQNSLVSTALGFKTARCSDLLAR